VPGPNSRRSGGANPLIRAALDFLKKNRKRKGGTNRMSGASLRHQQRGELKWNAREGGYRGSGYHHRPGGNDYPGRRIDAPVARHSNGVYEARPEFQNPSPPPPFVPKKNGTVNTFFPDDWSPQKVDKATTEAFKNGRQFIDDQGVPRWEGVYDGVKIKGGWDPETGKIGHGYPARVADQ
jgi:hypothetical protein